MLSRLLNLFRKPLQHVSHDIAYGDRPTPAFLEQFERLPVDVERERLIEAAATKTHARRGGARPFNHGRSN